jgi:N6-adenosine-specific RNA methylase IME4
MLHRLIDRTTDLIEFAKDRKFRTILADPPWRFTNRTGKMAPEHRRLTRYETLTIDDISKPPVEEITLDVAHLAEGLAVMQSWGFTYKSNIVWYKIRKDGGPDGRGVGFYFRNVTEMILFGVRGKNARTESAGRQVNFIATRKREHSRKPDEQYPLIESCSKGPYLELFARGTRRGWATCGDQADEYTPTWKTYARNSSGGERGA